MTTGKTGTEWLRQQSKRVGEQPEPLVSAVQASGALVEAWLQKHGVEYAPATLIPMDLIDEKRSRGNQARRDAVVADSVDRYANALRAGATFPPIVVFPLGGRLVIVDGNNRQAAARRAGYEEIMGFVIAEDTPSELIQLLTIEANAHHGVTPDTSWRVQQAFQLVSLGFTDQEASDAVNVNVTAIRVARAVQEAEERARKLKLTGFSELPVVLKQALGTLKDDPVFLAAVKVAMGTGMSLEQIREMTRMVKAISSEAQKLAAIAALAKERGIEAQAKKAFGRPTSDRRRVHSPRTQLVSGIGILVALDEEALRKAIITKHDRDMVRERMTLAEQKLVLLRKTIDAIEIPDEDE